MRFLACLLIFAFAGLLLWIGVVLVALGEFEHLASWLP